MKTGFDIGELKLGDVVYDNEFNDYAEVIKTERFREVDNEHEDIYLKYKCSNNIICFYLPDLSLGRRLEIIAKKGEMDMSNVCRKKTWRSYRVIINEPAVILFVDEVDPQRHFKYVSKAYNEEFDAEKGLLMCLAKANGISHLDLKRLLKQAKVQTKKENKPVPDDVKDSVDYNVEHFEINGGTFERVAQAFGIKTPKKQMCKKGKILVKSPKGVGRGRPHIFNIGDKVVIRECFDYQHEHAVDVEPMLNEVWEIDDVYFYIDGSEYYQITNNDEKKMIFAGKELYPYNK